MPRLNVYLPEDVYALASKWRGSTNLSEICARAIQDELKATNANRVAFSSLSTFNESSELETELGEKFGLAATLISEAEGDSNQRRERLGLTTARYLDQNICDGSLLAIAGGRQMWCVVRNLSPRRVRTTITALGVNFADPKFLHVHPNTLTTLAWLLYSPRAEAHVIGSGVSSNVWSNDLPIRNYPNYFVFASCAKFEKDSSLANLLGENAVNSLARQKDVGDFAYNFLDARGIEIPVPLENPHFALSAGYLRMLSKRSDSRVFLVAGGLEKLEMILRVLKSRLCNSLVTDKETAARLLTAKE